MRRLLLALSLLFFMTSVLPAEAGFIADKRASIKASNQLRADKKIIKKIINLQNKLASKYDYDGLISLYSDDFKCSDGFDKETYFKLIKETWATYSDISYTTEIKNVEINNDTAKVKVYETSLATSTHTEEDTSIFGELNSYSNGTYTLKKINGNWLITSEFVNNEKSFLKYGDARFVNMDLNSPLTVKAGEYYTAALTVETPEDTMIVASIGRDSIKYPQEKPEDVFRKMPSDNILERMFLANKEGKNEYNVASIGMTKSKVYGGQIHLYMAGIAFIMTRVNVEVKEDE